MYMVLSIKKLTGNTEQNITTIYQEKQEKGGSDEFQKLWNIHM